MNVASWLSQTKLKIPALDAELILLNILGQTDRTWLVTHADQILTDGENQTADQSVARRQKGEPLAYILGYKEFYGRNFKVTPDTLIPRPETEDIFDLIPAEAQTILDLGTGTGCIGITTKLEHPEKTVICSDISQKALEIAKENAKNLQADVQFIESSLLNQIPNEPDLVIANLPYVDPDWDWLDHKSLDYEPALALYAKDQGLELIKKLIDQAKNRQIKYLILEADPSQHETIINYAQKQNYNLEKQQNFILKLRIITV